MSLKRLLQALFGCKHKDCRLVQYQHVVPYSFGHPFTWWPMNISVLAKCKDCGKNVGGVVGNADEAWRLWGVVVEDSIYASAEDYMHKNKGKMPSPVVATPDSLPETF